MSFIEQEFKDRFKDQQSLDGVNPDQLWAGINSNIESQPTPATSNRKRIGVLVLLLLLLTCFVYFLINNSVKDSGPQIDQLQAEKKTPAPSANEPKLIQQNDPLITTNSTAEQKTETEINSTFENKPNNQINRTDTPPLSFNNSSGSLAPIDNQPFSKPLKTTDSEEKNSNQANSYSTVLKDTDDGLVPLASIPLNKTNFVNTLPPLTLHPLNERIPEIDLSLIKEEKIINNKTNHRFEISLLNGVNTSYSFFDGNSSNDPLEEELTSAYTNKPGHSTSLKLSWIINNKTRISSGIEYSNIWTRFNTVQEKEEEGLVEDYLIYFEYNPQTGDTINAVYDDLMLNGVNKRSVIHHNNFKYFSIPLEIGLQGQKGKLVYGVNAGLSANFFVRQKGKSLNENLEILEFDDSINSNTPFEKFFIAYHVNPFIDFGLSDKISLRLSPIVSYQTFGNSNLYQLKQSSLFTSINTGVVILLSD